MLKELFEAHFYGTFPIVEGRVLMLDERTGNGQFSLSDAKACVGCKFICKEDTEAREQLIVYSEQDVSILNLEQVFYYVKESVGEICDYMLETASTTSVVEMTCSSTVFVEDKRQKARHQLYNTLLKLHMNPVVRGHIESKDERYAIFSWKETIPYEGVLDEAEMSMKGMTDLTDEVYSPDNESKFEFGFKLREIRYPHVLKFS